MRNIELTVAKIDPNLWDKIKSGEKKFEIRTEEFKGTHVVFVDLDHPRNVLGIVKITKGIHVRLRPNYELARNMLCELAKIDSKTFDSLFIKGNDYVLVHKVSPIPLSEEYLKPIEDALRVFNLCHEMQMNGSMPWTHFLEKDGKVKED